MFRWVTTRRLLIGGCVLAALVTVFTSVPVGTSPPGSPGTDPYASAINFESVAGALGVPAPVLLLVWLVLIGMIWRRPRRRAIVAGVAGLAFAVALGCSFVAVRAAWLSLAAYEAPQVGDAAHHLWRLSGAGVTAVAAGVLVSMRPDRGPHVIGPMASGFVLAGVALFLLLGTGPPATIGLAVAIGLGALGSVALVAVAVAPLWRSGVSPRPRPLAESAVSGGSRTRGRDDRPMDLLWSVHDLLVRDPSDLGLRGTSSLRRPRCCGGHHGPRALFPRWEHSAPG